MKVHELIKELELMPAGAEVGGSVMFAEADGTRNTLPLTFEFADHYDDSDGTRTYPGSADLTFSLHDCWTVAKTPKHYEHPDNVLRRKREAAAKKAPKKKGGKK